MAYIELASIVFAFIIVILEGSILGKIILKQPFKVALKESFIEHLEALPSVFDIFHRND
ncbi:MAG: hypothetical protein HYT70_03405 [Candidatus Aenigmarchaeota archaeon]|nr:hypothetical protein [Candidatus Aenigmarchaeota archaeon]